MSISQGTTVGIQGIGGYLNLRSSHKSRDQSTINVNKERHQNNLKEMLVKKFFSKHGLNNIGKPGDQAYRTQQVLYKIITIQYGKFIEQNAFTEKNLTRFEISLA